MTPLEGVGCGGWRYNIGVLPGSCLPSGCPMRGLAYTLSLNAPSGDGVVGWEFGLKRYDGPGCYG